MSKRKKPADPEMRHSMRGTAMNKWARGVDHRTAFDRRMEEYLEKIQEEHMPEKAKMVVAINMQTGEYALGESFSEAVEAFNRSWPKGGKFVCRVDGTAAVHMRSPRMVRTHPNRGATCVN